MISDQQIQTLIDQKTKPLGALGQLESLAFQICRIQDTTTPKLRDPKIIVFAADHGLSAEGVSAYPKEVTAQMVLNFINGGAAINVFAKQNSIDLEIVDVGVDHDFESTLPIKHCKINRGTNNCRRESSMSQEELEACYDQASKLVTEQFKSGSNIIGFGEMGIGNTSSAALIQHYILNTPLDLCTGKGTGLDSEAYERKLSTLKKVVDFHGPISEPDEVLCTVGGFEIAAIVQGMIKAAELNMLILVDGFITSAAALVATKKRPSCRDNMIFCHLSEEQGHDHLLKAMNGEPILKMNMRLGEGSGCALAYPLIESAVRFTNDMASFESAEVSKKI